MPWDQYTQLLGIHPAVFFGAYPDPTTLAELLTTHHVRLFVDLTSAAEALPSYTLPPGVTRWSVPVVDQLTLADATAVALTQRIVALATPTYIHCRGGHGRAAVIAALVYGYYYNVSADKALTAIHTAHGARLKMDAKWRRLGAPQTALQKEQVKRLLAPYDFYGRASPFSNFSAHPVKSRRWGVTFVTSEALFQVFKLGDNPPQAELVRFAGMGGPDTAKAAGRRVKLRHDWEEVKYARMVETLTDKFRCNPEIGAVIAATGIQPIYEHTTNDAIWGDGGAGRTGLNYLGHAWAHVRRELLRSKEF